MVQKFLLLLYIALLISSCESYHIDNKENSSKGSLTIEVNQVGNTPFRDYTRAVTASEACTRLNYILYDMTGKSIKQVNQTSDMTNFGVASFDINEGDYRLVVIGHSSKSNPTMSNYEKIQFTNATGYSETFLCSGEITIGSEPVTFKVQLDRIVSLCRFVINDSYPENISKMQFYYTGGSGAFNSVTKLGCVNSKQTVIFDVTSGQKQFDLYTFLCETPSNIELKVTAFDDENNVLKEREFEIPLYFNEITWVEGSFFDDSNFSLSTTISCVSVNTDWNGEHHISF